MIVLAAALSLLSAAAAELDWPTFRHDHQRTGRAHGVGDIRNPAIIWRQPVGGRRALIELSAQAGESKTLVPFGKEVEPGKFAAVISEWDGAGRTLDLAGGGKPTRVRESTNVRFARFLPGARGFQKFVMEDGMLNTAS